MWELFCDYCCDLAVGFIGISCKLQIGLSAFSPKVGVENQSPNNF